jgi:hypothetical protein
VCMVLFSRPTPSVGGRHRSGLVQRREYAALRIPGDSLAHRHLGQP